MKMKSAIKNLIGLLGYDIKRKPSTLRTEALNNDNIYTHFSNLNLGCGLSHHLKGFINIDACSLPQTTQESAFIGNYDLTSGLPFPDESKSLVYSSHFFEHLTSQEGIFLFKEIHRVLRKGGVMRLVLPNMPLAIEHYATGRLVKFCEGHPAIDLIKEVIPRGTDTILTADWINLVFYDTGGEFGHKCFYDDESIFYSLKFVGFSHTEKSHFKSDFDLISHKDYSIYYEAIK